MTVYNETKNSVSVVNAPKAGYGWDYDESYLTYDNATDPISHMTVNYDSIGIASTITNESKNTVSVTNESKNSI